MTNRKILRPILLPSKNPSNIGLYEGRLYYSESGKNTDNWENQHIHFILDSKPNIGDWSINLRSPHDHKELCRIDNEIELERYVNNNENSCKKVEISTDELELLWSQAIPTGVFKLPKPTDSFVRKFIERYNNQNPITHVSVEYESAKICENPTESEFAKIIINPTGTGNTVEILEMKDNFTREEVLSFGLKCGIAGTLAERSKEDFNKMYLDLVEKHL